MGKDFKALGRNLVGGRADAYEDEIDKGQNEAMAEMQKAAEELGANAVVGVSLTSKGSAATGRCFWSPCRARRLVRHFVSGTNVWLSIGGRT